MYRSAKIVCYTLLLAPSIMIAEAAPGSNAMRVETIIYKHVDENGRVTYANSPIKGGARIDLEPLTVIPATPSGSLNATNAQSAPRAQAGPSAVPHESTQNNSGNIQNIVPTNPAAAQATAPAVSVASPGKPIHVASVLPLSRHAQAPAKPSEQAPDNNVVASSIETMQQLTQQRRAETRRRLLEGELQTEERMLVSAKSKLEDEQKISGTIRAMRASFSATAEAVTPQKPLISPETRAEIERHFERIRNLQDQVAMHENHSQTLREQLNAMK